MKIFCECDLIVDPELFNELDIYLTPPKLLALDVFVMDQSHDKWRRVVVSLIDRLTQTLPIPIMAYRIKKSIAIVFKYHAVAFKGIVPAIMQAQRKIIDAIDANPGVLFGYDLDLDMFTSIAICGWAITAKTAAFRELADKIFMMLMRILKTETIPFLKDGSVERDPLAAAVYCLRIYREEQLYMNAWKIFTHHMLELIEPLTKRVAGGKEPNLLDNFLVLFDFTICRPSFNHDDHRAVAQTFNSFLKQLVKNNDNTKAVECFKWGKEKLGIYEKCAAQESEVATLFTT